MKNIKLRYIIKNTATGQISSVFKKIEDIESRGMADGIQVLRRDMFTGRKDRVGKSIYENDILEDDIKMRGTVYYDVFKSQFMIGFVDENINLINVQYFEVKGFVFPKIRCDNKKNEEKINTQSKGQNGEKNAHQDREEEKAPRPLPKPGMEQEKGVKGNEANKAEG